MTDVRIIFGGEVPISLPDGICLGVQGEHNAARLVITLPQCMVEGMDFHIVTIGGVMSAYVTEEPNADGAYRDGNVIYFPLTALYTAKRFTDLSVTAYKQIGDAVQIVDKTPTVYGYS